MVLVDTSVWVRALAGVAPYREQLDDLLSRNEVLGHDLVYGELLIGDRGGRRRLLVDYLLMRWSQAATHEQVVALVLGRNLHGMGIGWIDAHLLASALIDGARLWTADQALAKLANTVG